MLFTEDGGPSRSRSKRFGEPPVSASAFPSDPLKCATGPGHDRGRCPLYVRAQLETAGLPWTQRDLTARKATARETGEFPAHGPFPQVVAGVGFEPT
jgi:hypothetical protein